MKLSGISIYPVKSCAGIELTSVRLDRFGLVGDRRWLVVDQEGRFVSQRNQSRMALVKVDNEGRYIRLTLGTHSIEVSVPNDTAEVTSVRIWGDSVEALLADRLAGDWLCQQLRMTCSLVYMPDSCLRFVDTQYAHERETVSFADGFPVLLISEASLEDLNSRLDQPVPMNRFRPNLVISGCEPFAEDGWNRIRIGEIEFEIVKSCSRCVIPSIDQATANPDPQINRVLASFRRFDGQVLFGQNLLYRGEGSLGLGDEVVVLD